MEDILYLMNPWWSGKSVAPSVPRPTYLDLLSAHTDDGLVGVLIGSRRVGKTTLLFQYIERLLTDGVPSTHVLYALLDHPRLANVSIETIVNTYRTIHNLKRDERVFLFLDEVQYVPRWEQDVKALVDLERVKVFVSGSASTLIFQRSSFLTGRYAKIVVYPLSFGEYLTFRKAAIAPGESYRYIHYLNEYLRHGGYPEYVLRKNPQYFADLSEAIIFKDIVALYGIRNPTRIRDLLLLLADRAGHQTSFTKLAHILSLDAETIRDYVSYLSQSFLVTEIPRYATSRSKQIYAAKKFYLNDTGFLYHLVGTYNAGAAAEQAVFHHIARHGHEAFFYYEDMQEVDLVVRHQQKTVLLEVKYGPLRDSEKEQERLTRIAGEIKASAVCIVTKDEQRQIIREGIRFSFAPLWSLLLHDTKAVFRPPHARAS